MKILVVNKFYWPKGGSERVLFDLADAYAAAGHQVIPFSMAAPENLPTPWAAHFAPGVRYEDARGFGALAAAARAVYSRPARRSLAALLAEVRPDVAHLHNFHHQLSPSIVDALREAGVPAVHTLHDYKVVCPNYLLYTEGAVCRRCLSGSFHHAVVHRCVRGSVAASAVAALEMTIHRLRRTLERGIAHFVSPSRFLAERLVEAGTPRERIRVVPNGVDPEAFAAADGPGAGFLYAGRLSREKGVGTLLDAIGKVTEAGLAVLGTGPLEAELRAHAERVAPGRVEFTGFLPREELMVRLRAARAVVLPSEWYENAPLAALEAQACGVPVVAARIGGLPEIVREGRSGLLFTPGSADDLAVQLGRLAHEPGLAERLGQGGRTVVGEEFTLAGQAAAMLGLLEEVASSASR
jgi:glycosyltransferase involved in cell wall biosynthesis